MEGEREGRRPKEGGRKGDIRRGKKVLTSRGKRYIEKRQG